MAIVKCKACGGDVSDKAISCPHCGAELAEKPKAAAVSTICGECGAQIPEGMKACPYCGWPVPRKAGTADDPSVPVTKSKSTTGKRISTRTIIILAIALAAILLTVGIAVVRQNTLTGDDKIAYELILSAAKYFKNPSSVRLVSGTVGVGKDCLFAGISAKNGFGSRSTAYYYIDYSGILEDDEPYSFYKSKDELNIDKINRMLKKELEAYD